MNPQKNNMFVGMHFRMLRICFVLASLFFVSKSSFAGPQKTVYSRSSPSTWTTNTHWSSTSGGGSCACTPDESKDIMYIETTTNSAAGLTFGSSATLTIRNNSTLTITGNVVFTNGAVVVIEAGSRLVITGNLTNNNNSDEITVNGSVSVGGNYTGENGSAMLGAGTMSVTGTATTNGSGTVFGSNGSCTGCEISPTNPLPVEFLFFSASPLSNSIFLEWSTAAEFNSAYFIVQHSADGNAYENFGKLDAAGNSNVVNHYSIVDKEPYNGISFYRLKQVDNDGKFEFSDVVAVNFQPNDLITIYPNPTTGAINVDMKAEKEEEVLLIIRDVLGKEIFTHAFVLTQDSNVFTVNKDGNIPPGVYTVIASSDNRLSQSKIVIR